MELPIEIDIQEFDKIDEKYLKFHTWTSELSIKRIVFEQPNDTIANRIIAEHIVSRKRTALHYHSIFIYPIKQGFVSTLLKQIYPEHPKTKDEFRYRIIFGTFIPITEAVPKNLMEPE